MNYSRGSPRVVTLMLALALIIPGPARAQQQIGAGHAAVVPISHGDRVYTAEQFSNTVSVTDPMDNRPLGVIRLGDPLPGNLSPMYRGQLLVHGLGFSPDHLTLAVVSIGSNSVSFIDTESNAVKHVTYVGRSPHEASFTPETVVISVATHEIVGRVAQASPFCPNIAASPDGRQVWFTLKDVGRVMVFDARPPFALLKTIDTGPITNHVNIVHNAHGTFAYVTVGGLNEVQVFRTDDFTKVAMIAVGKLPHGIWPSGDGSRVYVGLENDDGLVAIDALTNTVIATVPIGQAPQAIVYVSNAVPRGDGLWGLQPAGIAASATHLSLAPAGDRNADRAKRAPTSVALFDQGLVQVLQAAVTSLQPKQPYVLALSTRPDGSGALEPLAEFVTNPAGAAIVNALGPIRRVVQETAAAPRRYLVIVPGTSSKLGAPVQ